MRIFAARVAELDAVEGLVGGGRLEFEGVLAGLALALLRAPFGAEEQRLRFKGLARQDIDRVEHDRHAQVAVATRIARPCLPWLLVFGLIGGAFASA